MEYLYAFFIYYIWVLKIIEMLDKKKVLKSIKELPDSFSLDELIDRVILLQKIEIGLEQSKSAHTFTNSEAKSKLKKWLK